MGQRENAGESPALTEKLLALRSEVEKVFVGSSRSLELALVALFAGGHLIIEDVPGVGKTILAKTLARALDCKFRRVQFTPDLLPSDVLGVTIYDEETSEFVFKEGPIFANIVLADEINRTTPRTQSSLLEAMNEYQVTVDGVAYPLPRPSCVLATQNPFEFEGTYPLPESQLDRFFLRMSIGYPNTEQGKRIIQSQKLRHPIETVRPVMNGEDVCRVQHAVRNVHVSESVLQYIMDIIEQTRGRPDVRIGVSPRGGVHLYRAAQALALLRGRDYCEPDDVKELAAPVLSHRMRCKGVGADVGNFEAAARIIDSILDNLAVPL